MKTYKSVYEAIDDGIFEESDIVVFWGKRGKGKSSLQTKFCVDFMQPNEYTKYDLERSESVCDLLNEAGISNLRPPKDHLVFVDTFAQSTGFGYHQTSAYETDLLSFGLPTKYHKPLIACPYGKYAFDEIQDILDSHDGNLPKFISKAFELSRHPRLFIMLALQRPMRLPKDVRDLATFVECVKRKNIYNNYGLLLGTMWTCNIIYNNTNLEKYLTTYDPSLIDVTVNFYFEGDIYACYDPYYFLPLYYRGMENEGLILKRSEKVEFNKDSFQAYYDRHPSELPDYWRKTPKESKDGNRKTTKSE